MTSTDTIALATFKELLSSGAINSIELAATPDGFIVKVSYGNVQKVLQAKRGHIRKFKSLERAAKFIRVAGATHLVVDLTDWDLSSLSGLTHSVTQEE